MSSAKGIQKFYPVSGITLAGRLLVTVVKFLFSTLGLFTSKRWENPKAGFEENPVNFNTSDVLYLGYKYYVKPHETTTKGFVPQPFKNCKKGEDLALTIHAGGDLMPYNIMLNGNANNLWKYAGDDFFGAQIVMANLETPLDFTKPPSFVPEVMLNDMLFNGSRQLMDIFTSGNRYKFHFLSLANNHMLDVGYKGLQNTIAYLNASEIAWGGVSSSAIADYTIIDQKDVKTGIVNFTYSLNRLVEDPNEELKVHYLQLNKPNIDLTPLSAAISNAKSAGADIIIASLHMGNAYQSYPSEHIIKQVQRIFYECCPDVLLIHHPHNLQPGQIIPFTCKFSGELKNGICFHSLGDFVAYDIFNWSHLTGYARLEVYRSKSGFVIYPDFNLLHLQRSPKGELTFIPWAEVNSNIKFQNKEYFYLKNWYNKHVVNFFR